MLLTYRTVVWCHPFPLSDSWPHICKYHHRHCSHWWWSTSYGFYKLAIRLWLPLCEGKNMNGNHINRTYCVMYLNALFNHFCWFLLTCTCANRVWLVPRHVSNSSEMWDVPLWSIRWWRWNLREHQPTDGV